MLSLCSCIELVFLFLSSLAIIIFSVLSSILVVRHYIVNVLFYYESPGLLIDTIRGPSYCSLILACNLTSPAKNLILYSCLRVLHRQSLLRTSSTFFQRVSKYITNRYTEWRVFSYCFFILPNFLFLLPCVLIYMSFEAITRILSTPLSALALAVSYSSLHEARSVAAFRFSTTISLMACVVQLCFITAVFLPITD